MLEAPVARPETVEDPRCERKAEHRLLDIPAIAVRAVLGEAESLEDVALDGRRERERLEGFLASPNGIPSHDTFRRVLMPIDPAAFERRLPARARAVSRPGEEGARRRVATGGKTVRRSFDLRQGRSPPHLASAHATGGGLVPARRATETGGGGPAVLPGPLDGLDLRGCLVGLDAPARRPGSAERVVTGGDCLLAPEGDRRKARAEVEAWFATNAFALGAPPRPCFDAFDESRGRLVRRRVFACTDRATFATLRDRPGLAAVVAVETVRGAPGRGEARAGIRRHPSGATLPPAALAAAIRNRWRAEDGPRRVPDVVFREDASRVRERDAARDPAPLRKIAPNLARADTTLGASLKGERGYAGRDDASTAAPIAG